MKLLEVIFDKQSPKFEGSTIGFYDRLYVCNVMANRYGVICVDSIVYDSDKLLVLDYECEDIVFPQDMLNIYGHAGAFSAKVVSNVS